MASSTDKQAVEMIPVASSNVASVGYDEEAQELYVEFKPGGNPYIYQGVSKGLFAAMMASPSKGRFVHSHLKDQYSFRR